MNEEIDEQSCPKNRTLLRLGIAAIPLVVLMLSGLVCELQRAETLRRLLSVNNLKQIGLAILHFNSVNGHFPPRASLSEQGNPLLSWRVHILPYIDQQELYSQFHLDEPWDSENNKQLIERMPDIYQHPSHAKLIGKTLYLMPVCKGAPFANNEPVDLYSIADGVSDTILLIEANPDRAVVWTAPHDLPIDTADPGQGLGHVRSSGQFIALFFDGHHATFDTVDPQLLMALFTSQGGEVVSDGKHQSPF